MKVIVLYRPNSEYGRISEEFVRDFQQRHQEAKIELLDADSRDGSAMASLYDIVRYPAILAMRDDGSTLNIWEGEELPLMDEVASYLLS